MIRPLTDEENKRIRRWSRAVAIASCGTVCLLGILQVIIDIMEGYIPLINIGCEG